MIQQRTVVLSSELPNHFFLVWSISKSRGTQLLLPDMKKQPPKAFKNIKIEDNLFRTLKTLQSRLDFKNITEVINHFMPKTRQVVFDKFEDNSNAIMNLLHYNPSYLDDDLIIIDVVRAIHTYAKNVILGKTKLEGTEILKLIDDIVNGEET